MAEAAVATVVVKAVEIAGKLISGRANQSYNLQENISWIESQMRFLQSYLKDAESKKKGSHEVANLIISIRDLAYDVDDILDTYLPEIQSHSHNTRERFHFLKHASCICFGVKTNKFVVEIEKIKKRAAELEVCRRNCGITVDSNAAGPSSDADDLWGSRKLFLHAPESKIFGRGETLQKLEKEMVRKNINRCRIVSVVGPGGVGKTTVAKRIYHKAKNEFQSAAMDERKDDLEKNLYSFLKDKRYIGGGESSLIPLNILSENEGRELFFDLIFSASEEPLPPVVKDIGEEIVVRCGGLPLALVVAVGMLQSKERNKHAWNEVLASMKEGDENDCLNILALSYQDLPAELKPFFLYFGVFAEDHEIFISELTRLLLAEKLIQDDGVRKLDNIVEAHIDKLIARNLIQVCRRRSDGRVRSCRIHDLLHKLCIQMAEDSNFFSTRNDLLQSVGFNSIVRRVTTNSWSSSVNAFQNFRIPPKLHSLLCFREGEELFKFVKRNASDLRFLSLLTVEVEGVEFHLPDEIANLSGLKYFKLRVSMSQPASSMFRSSRVEVALENLETLHFRFDNWFYIKPSSIRKMSNLRKVRVSNYPEREMMTVLDDATTTPALEKLEALKLGLNCMSTTRIKWLNLSRYQYLVKLYLFMHAKIEGSLEFPPNLIKITFESIHFQGNFIEPLKKLFKLEIIKLKNCRAIEPLDFSGEHNYPQLQVLVLWDTNFLESKLDKILYQPYPFPPSPIIPERLRKMMVTTDQY
ncbi:hypothetical protein BUALT_Bualt01G0093800 [Buddleja alternifolia]|uniref:Uncharacterized protein n=1 Tax=Buddleja alternifolia TaxID=168488 RepID=A0AAV6YBP8_9LAMI|nr:hypothetical protein BUALT_Bualt01G0093800 [Buddleja alternifolia]